MRMWRALVLITFTSCQCLQPVDEDAGVEPFDAGFISRTCTRPSDCSGSPYVMSWCGDFLNAADAGYSCVDGKCVAQCDSFAGQTCVQDRGVECLRCPSTTSCIPPTCGGGFDFTFSVSEYACYAAPPFDLASRIREAPSTDGGCGVPLYLQQPDGGESLFGYLFLQSARGLSARIDSLGGTCLVTELPTGAPRLLLDCPLCQVALGP